MEIRPRSDFLIKKEELVKPVKPIDEAGMGSVPSKLREDKSTLPEKQKDTKRFSPELYQKG